MVAAAAAAGRAAGALRACTAAAAAAAAASDGRSRPVSEPVNDEHPSLGGMAVAEVGERAPAAMD